MFDNKLKMKEKDGVLQGTITLSGVVVEASHPAKSKNARDKVIHEIVTAAEFFPLKCVVGKDTLAKAMQLFAAIKTGDLAQKTDAEAQVKQITANAKRSDSTAQDLLYALARLERQAQDHKFNLEGDFTFDGLGFSPANLRKNLDEMASRSRPMAEAKNLFFAIAKGNERQRENAKAKLRSIRQRVNAGSGDTVVGRAILAGVRQYVKANNASALRGELFGDETVTVGFSFKKLKKKLKKAVKAVKKNPMKALAYATLGPLAAVPAAAKAIKKNPLKALTIVTLGPAAAPILASKRGRTALKVTAKAKKGDKKAIKQIQLVNRWAKKGSPAAKKSLQAIKTADKAIQKLPPAAVKEMQKSPEEQYHDEEELRLNQEDTRYAEESYAQDYDGESYNDYGDDYYDESLEGDDDGEFVVESSEDQIILGIAIDHAEELGFSLKKFTKKVKKGIKKIKKIAKPLAKVVMPLAAGAANLFAPGAGTLISKALPALIDSVPKKARPKMAQIARGMSLIKAADEMVPGAAKKIETIKKLAGQGVKDAEIALNALKVAKGTQQIAETIVVAKKNAAKPAPVPAPVPAQLSASKEPIPVKIVAWGK